MSVGYNVISTTDELLQAYTTMFLFMGSSVSMEPGKGGLPSLCEQGLLRNLPITSENKSFRQASNLLKSPCPHSGDCSNAISGNYHDLFGSGRDSHTQPSASIWLNEGENKDDYQETLLEFYEKYDFRKNEFCDLDYDHLGIQILFVNLLLEKYLTQDNDFVKKVIGKDLSLFITEKMLPWVTTWADAVATASYTKCYTGIAGLLVGSLQDVVCLLERR